MKNIEKNLKKGHLFFIFEIRRDFLGKIPVNFKAMLVFAHTITHLFTVLFLLFYLKVC
jgi:hypothetical protein